MTAGETPDGAPRADPMRVGPSFGLPGWRMLLASAGGAAVVGLASWPLIAALKPFSVDAAWKGPAGVAVAFAAAIVLMRPWRRLPVGRWLMAWLGGLGVRFLATVAVAGGLLYFSPHSERLALGLVVAAAHFAALMAESAVVARTIRRSSGPAAGAASASLHESS